MCVIGKSDIASVIFKNTEKLSVIFKISKNKGVIFKNTEKISVIFKISKNKGVISKIV
jgi:hypothetical protein